MGPKEVTEEKMEDKTPFIAPINSFDDSSRDIRLLPREFLDTWPSLIEYVSNETQN